MKTIEELRALTRAAILAVVYSSGAEGKDDVARVREALAERGFASNCHVGIGRELTPDEQVEWYAGQLVNIVDLKVWGAMLLLTSLLENLCPAPIEAP
jgi:methylmalonyl-CoA mutase cobalamin-binding subunit